MYVLHYTVYKPRCVTYMYHVQLTKREDTRLVGTAVVKLAARIATKVRCFLGRLSVCVHTQVVTHLPDKRRASFSSSSSYARKEKRRAARAGSRRIVPTDGGTARQCIKREESRRLQSPALSLYHTFGFVWSLLEAQLAYADSLSSFGSLSNTWMMSMPWLLPSFERCLVFLLPILGLALGDMKT